MELYSEKLGKIIAISDEENEEKPIVMDDCSDSLVGWTHSGWSHTSGTHGGEDGW